MSASVVACRDACVRNPSASTRISGRTAGLLHRRCGDDRARRSLASRQQRRDAEIARRGIEAVAQRLGHGNAVRGAILPLVMALLARQPDALDAGQPLGATHRPDRGVDATLELPPPARTLRPIPRRWHGRYWSRLPGSLTKSMTSRPNAAPLSVPARSPMIRLKPITLVIADRQQQAFFRALGIGERLAVRGRSSSRPASPRRAAS